VAFNQNEVKDIKRLGNKQEIIVFISPTKPPDPIVWRGHQILGWTL